MYEDHTNIGGRCRRPARSGPEETKEETKEDTQGCGERGPEARVEADGVVSKAKKRYRTGTASLGRCLAPNLDDVAEALVIAEGEPFR